MPVTRRMKMKRLSQKDPRRRALVSLLASMLIFGTIGLFRRWLPVPSGFLAMMRGLVGAGMLLLWLRLRQFRLDLHSIRGSAVWLILSGTAIGFNWILLFEAYRYTTVAIATLCYYMMPVFVLAFSLLFLRESLTGRAVLCAGIALVGMVPVSGVLEGTAAGNIRGILFGIGAAVLYSSVVLINKKIKGIRDIDRTVPQLTVAALVLVPYVLAVEAEELRAVSWNADIIFLLLVVGVVHTGLAYTLYFSSVAFLPARTVALFGYVDPVAAISLSWLFLKERMSPWQIAGSVLIIVALLLSEKQLSDKKTGQKPL